MEDSNKDNSNKGGENVRIKFEKSSLVKHTTEFFVCCRCMCTHARLGPGGGSEWKAGGGKIGTKLTSRCTYKCMEAKGQGTKLTYKTTAHYEALSIGVPYC